MALLSRALAALALACAALPAMGEEPAALEDGIKATYVYKFAPFVTWPKPAAAGAAFAVCVSGADGVTQLLPQAVAGQQVNGHAIELRRLADADTPDNCQILYVAASPASAQLVEAARGKPILTVTDGALSDHGIVRFVVVGHHVRFDIDESLAVSGGLSISSKLLGLANQVMPAPQEKR
jgi:YfiR/HmsC-like